MEVEVHLKLATRLCKSHVREAVKDHRNVISDYVINNFKSFVIDQSDALTDGWLQLGTKCVYKANTYAGRADISCDTATQFFKEWPGHSPTVNIS